MADADAEIREIEAKIELQEILIKISSHPVEFIHLINEPQHIQKLQDFLGCSEEMVELVLHRMYVDVFMRQRRAKAEADAAYLRNRLAQLRAQS